MASKIEYVKKLDKVKLIIGNGFDLHCHLNTRYSDYFNSIEEKNKCINKWVNSFLSFNNRLSDYLNSNLDNNKELWINCDGFENINIWDVFFFLNSNVEGTNLNDIQWCDIESTMLEWFKEKNSVGITQNWDLVLDLINSNSRVVGAEDNARLLAAYAYKKNGENKFKNKNNFYCFLLDQLKLFEINFGKYIDNIHFNKTFDSFGCITAKTHYIYHARHTIENLCSLEKIVSIDSFNYDNFEGDENYNRLLHNINGDMNNPIFGVDSNVVVPGDIRYIFTKASRRMEIEMINQEYITNNEFLNLIVFGHSLNEADYNYFFSVFDKIDITNLASDSKVVFAFSIYDKEDAENIKMKLRIAIFKMFNAYSTYKGISTQPNRLLDNLTIQGKVLMYEIPQENNY